MVALGADQLPLRPPDIVNGRMSGDECCDVFITIIYNDQLFLPVVLSQKVADRKRDEPTSVGGGHDAGDKGLYSTHLLNSEHIQ